MLRTVTKESGEIELWDRAGRLRAAVRVEPGEENWQVVINENATTHFDEIVYPLDTLPVGPPVLPDGGV